MVGKSAFKCVNYTIFYAYWYFLIRDIRNKRAVAAITSTINMVLNMEMKLLVEGIDSQAQVGFLISNRHYYV